MILLYFVSLVTIVMHLRSFSSGGTTQFFLTCNLQLVGTNGLTTCLLVPRVSAGWKRDGSRQE